MDAMINHLILRGELAAAREGTEERQTKVLLIGPGRWGMSHPRRLAASPVELLVEAKLKAFLHSAATRTPPSAGGWDGDPSARIREATLASARKGQPVS